VLDLGVRPCCEAQACSNAIALLRRSIPAVLVSDRPSMSISSRVTPYRVTSSSSAAAIDATL
jgi:hypothetical protein